MACRSAKFTACSPIEVGVDDIIWPDRVATNIAIFDQYQFVLKTLEYRIINTSKLSSRSSLIKLIAISVAAAILAYAVILFFGDVSTLLDAAMALSFSGWVIILSLSMLNYLMRFWRWQLYLNRWDYEIPLRLSIVYYFSGFALTTSPGKAGEAIRSVFLKRHGVEYRRSIAAVFVERYLDIVVIAVLATLSITLLDIGVLPIAITLGLAIATMPIIRSESLRQKLKSAYFHRKKGLVSQIVDRLVSLLEASSEIMSRQLLYVGFSIGLLGWLSECVAFWVIAQYLSIDIQLLPAIGIYAVASLVGAISFIPGGLGSTEAVMILLLTAAGADAPIAIAATIISRVATLWFAVALGGVCLFWASTNKRYYESNG